MVRGQRDYGVAAVPGTQAGIYLQGGTEHTHRITSSLLSNVAVRAGKILDSIALRKGKGGEGLRLVRTGTSTGERHPGLRRGGDELPARA